MVTLLVYVPITNNDPQAHFKKNVENRCTGTYQIVNDEYW
jgi:hypothetical protein